jgi:NAD(P)-dependent dehydrogenase (short-subunit alcohol dehydrogenase family)
MNPLQADLSIFSLTGKTILVAGASKGIGLAIAEGLAHAGANVVGFGRSSASASLQFKYKQCDVLDRSGFASMADACVKEYGAINAYFHVAGITEPANGTMQNIDAFEEILRVNLTSAYSCCRHVGTLMVNQNKGSVVTVTSIGSMLAFPNNPGYLASKGGLRMMSKALALDLGKFNIRVNSLVPGYIHTDMTHSSYSDPEKSSIRSERTMLGRWGQKQDLIGAAIFLASDASSYITGTDLVVDGGWTAKGL